MVSEGETDLPRLVVAQDVSHVREQIRSLPAAVTSWGVGTCSGPSRVGYFFSIRAVVHSRKRRNDQVEVQVGWWLHI
jgi:hypothetical protein